MKLWRVIAVFAKADGSFDVTNPVYVVAIDSEIAKIKAGVYLKVRDIDADYVTFFSTDIGAVKTRPTAK